MVGTLTLLVAAVSTAQVPPVVRDSSAVTLQTAALDLPALQGRAVEALNRLAWDDLDASGADELRDQVLSLAADGAFVTLPADLQRALANAIGRRPRYGILLIEAVPEASSRYGPLWQVLSSPLEGLHALAVYADGYAGRYEDPLPAALMRVATAYHQSGWQEGDERLDVLLQTLADDRDVVARSRRGRWLVGGVDQLFYCLTAWRRYDAATARLPALARLDQSVAASRAVATLSAAAGASSAWSAVRLEERGPALRVFDTGWGMAVDLPRPLGDNLRRQLLELVARVDMERFQTRVAELPAESSRDRARAGAAFQLEEHHPDLAEAVASQVHDLSLLDPWRALRVEARIAQLDWVGAAEEAARTVGPFFRGVTRLRAAAAARTFDPEAARELARSAFEAPWIEIDGDLQPWVWLAQESLSLLGPLVDRAMLERWVIAHTEEGRREAAQALIAVAIPPA